jgi:small subunit ribosomal protein S17
MSDIENEKNDETTDQPGNVEAKPQAPPLAEAETDVSGAGEGGVLETRTNQPTEIPAAEPERVEEGAPAEPEAAVEESPTEPVPDEAVEDEPAAEEPVAETPSADEPVAADEAAAEAPAAEAPIEAPPAEAPAAEAPAQPAPTEAARTRSLKHIPRSERRQRTKTQREKPKTRKPIVRLEKPERERGRRQERRGVVVSDAMDKTIVVKVESIRAHQRYKKVIRRSVKFHAHDEQNQAHIGDLVRIVETKPLSKTKRWRLAEVLEAAK